MVKLDHKTSLFHIKRAAEQWYGSSRGCTNKEMFVVTNSRWHKKSPIKIYPSFEINVKKISLSQKVYGNKKLKTLGFYLKRSEEKVPNINWQK
jgi:hypothetical protein